MSTNEQLYKKVITKRMSVGSILLASILVLFELALIFSKPSFGFAGHTFYVSQGIGAFAMLIGGLFWAIAEMFTKAGRSFWTLFSRFFAAFLFGGIIGGIAGAASNHLKNRDLKTLKGPPRLQAHPSQARSYP